MKKFMFMLLLIASIVWGQDKPIRVDLSSYVGDPVNQFGNGCQIAALTKLKTFNWNYKFQRDPSLLENQFSPNVIWNQIIDPKTHYSGTQMGFELMKNQGCASLSDFSEEMYPDIFPDRTVREKGLHFRSKELNVLNLRTQDSAEVAQFLENLKDSLRNGVCFTISYPLYNYIHQLYNNQRAVYNCYKGLSKDSIYAGHASVVVGYDDTVTTASGKGGFILLNSWGKSFGNNGLFILDYNWVFFPNWFQTCYFMKEDFQYQPELTLNLDISGLITGMDVYQRRFIFTDTVYDGIIGRMDYQDYLQYYNYVNLINLKQVNGKKIGAGQNWDSNRVYLPLHNDNGTREILFDLTDYAKASDFKSLDLIVCDPISATYKGVDDKIIYTYSRSSQIKINGCYVKYLGTNKRIVGNVKVLADTTITCYDFYSIPVDFYQSVPGKVKESVSTFKRILISFRVEDTTYFNHPPVFTHATDSLITFKDTVVSYKFEALDEDGDSVKFSITPGSGGKIDSISGLFTFTSGEIGRHPFQVFITDGKDKVVDSFYVRVTGVTGVKDQTAKPIEFSLAQNYPNPFNPETAINFTIAKSGFVTLKVYDLLGREVTTLVNDDMLAGNHVIHFSALNLASGVYIYKLTQGSQCSIRKMNLVK